MDRNLDIYEIALIISWVTNITKQDLYNIRTQFSIIHNEIDSASVMAWVSEMGTLDYNPVLAYKPQGVDSNHNYVQR